MGDCDLARHQRLDARAQGEGQVVDRQHVERCGHGGHNLLDPVARSRQWHGQIAHGQICLQQGDDGRVGVREVTFQGCGHAHLSTQGQGKLIGADESQLDQMGA